MYGKYTFQTSEIKRKLVKTNNLLMEMGGSYIFILQFSFSKFQISKCPIYISHTVRYIFWSCCGPTQNKSLNVIHETIISQHFLFQLSYWKHSKVWSNLTTEGPIRFLPLTRQRLPVFFLLPQTVSIQESRRHPCQPSHHHS